MIPWKKDAGAWNVVEGGCSAMVGCKLLIFRMPQILLCENAGVIIGER